MEHLLSVFVVFGVGWSMNSLGSKSSIEYRLAISSVILPVGILLSEGLAVICLKKGLVVECVWCGTV